MTTSGDGNGAFGRPGIHPRWTDGGKVGVGTAYGASSQIWFTLWNGIITEVYYPNVDRPRLPDLRTNDEWHTVQDTLSATTTLGVEFVDIPITAGQRTPIRFTFFSLKSNSGEGRDDLVEARP